MPEVSLKKEKLDHFEWPANPLGLNPMENSGAAGETPQWPPRDSRWTGYPCSGGVGKNEQDSSVFFFDMTGTVINMREVQEVVLFLSTAFS